MNFSGGGSFWKCIPIVPGQPAVGIYGQLIRVLLQFGEVIEGIHLVQFTSVDQAHEQVAHAGAVLGLIEVGILAMQDSLLQGSFADIIHQRRQMRLV
jgi:hypothetical protein